MSPTQRSLKFLRDSGWTVAIVEKWNQWAKIRQDLFGFADLVSIKAGEGIVAVQVTTKSNMSARVKKILSEPRALVWVQAGGKIEVHGWAKQGERGKRKKWELTKTEVTP